MRYDENMRYELMMSRVRHGERGSVISDSPLVDSVDGLQERHPLRHWVPG